MELITRRERAKNAYTSWIKQYGKGKSDIAKMLVNLGNSPKPDDVDKIIGNSSWTEVSCSECKKPQDSVVIIGEEPDYESYTAYICRSCLIKALAYFEDDL